MRFIKFVALVAASATAMYFIWLSLKFILKQFFEFFSISANAATAGAYTMESVVSLFAFGLVLSRLLWALRYSDSLKNALKLLHTKTAILATSIGGLIAIGFKNRIFWWSKHLFTDEAYFHYSFDATVNSILVSTLICFIVYSINSDTDKKRKIPQSLSLWLLGIISFSAATIFYMYTR